VPGSLASCRATGIEVEEWVRAGVVDYLAPSAFYDTEINLPFGEFVALARGTPVRVYACPSEIVGPGVHRPTPHAAMRAAALNAWRQGVDGIYAMNFHGYVVEDLPYRDLLFQLADPAALERESKLYAVTGSYESARAGTAEREPLQVIPRRLPCNLSKAAGGEPQAFDFLMSDDVAMAEEQGALETLRLTIGVGNLTFKDQLEFSLNGKRLGDRPRRRLHPDDWMAVWSPHAYRGVYDLYYDLRGESWLRQGANRLEVTLRHRNPEVDADLILEGFSLEITYRTLRMRV
jgi:hypothetical protein